MLDMDNFLDKLTKKRNDMKVVIPVVSCLDFLPCTVPALNIGSKNSKIRNVYFFEKTESKQISALEIRFF